MSAPLPFLSGPPSFSLPPGLLAVATLTAFPLTLSLTPPPRYEFFKKFYSDLAGPETAQKYKTLIYLAGSASAEFIADVALCPFETVKVRMQTSIPPPPSGSTFKAISNVTSKEGWGGLYKGIGPLWARQIPCTYPFSPEKAPANSNQRV